MSADLHPIDPRFLARLERARNMAPEERVREAARLSAVVVQILCDGVRAQMPNASDDEVMEAVRQRVRRLRSPEPRA